MDIIYILIIYSIIGLIVSGACCQVWDIGELSALLFFTVIWPIVLLIMIGVKIGKLYEKYIPENF